MSNRYEYSRLEGSEAIRIIHLAPGSDDDIITCTLESVTLGQGVEYEALSYAWGDPNDLRTIKCRGKDLEITNSLFTGLRQLRRSDVSRVLWADAICINQQDVAEKSEQVKLMSQIYSQPQRILIWLGEDMGGLDGVKESLETVLHMVPPVHYDAETIRECSLQFCRNTARFEKEGRADETIAHHDWRPINALLDRPWFSRKWIVQEVSMAPGHLPRIVMCGSVEIAWETLSTIGYALFTYGVFWQARSQSLTPHGGLVYEPGPIAENHFSANAVQPVISLVNANLVKLIQHFTTGNLFDCVMATYAFKCTDSRDHIYSLLGLSRRGPRPVTIQPDYTKTAKQVLFDFARSVLLDDQNTNLLAIAPNNEIGIEGEDTQRTKLPSWVPDLVSGAPAASLTGFSIREPVFQAGLRSAGMTTDAKPILEDVSRGRLHVQGRIVDVVKYMAPCPWYIQVVQDEDDVVTDEAKQQDVLRRRRAKVWFEDCLLVAFGEDESLQNGAQAGESTDNMSSDDGRRRLAQDLWTHQTKENKRRFARAMMMDHCGFRDPLPEDTVDAMVDFVEYVCRYFDKDYSVANEAWGRMVAHGGMIEWMVLGVAFSRRFCRTKGGRFGQIRNNAREGDLICIVVGCQVPLVIRPTESGESHELIGDCYVSEVMHGEAMVDQRYTTVEIILE